MNCVRSITHPFSLI